MCCSKKLYFTQRDKRNYCKLGSDMAGWHPDKYWVSNRLIRRLLHAVRNDDPKMNIEIVYYQSPIGALEIRSNGNAISDVLFVNSWKGAKINEEELNFTSPKSPVIKTCIKQLDEYFAGKRTEFTIHTSQVGTPFQQSVWAELCRIPYGRTISYLELSKRIGNVKAIRAVGTANGNNSICIIVPCHRVIGSNGELVGYGGDLWRKKWLLEHEGKIANGVQTLF